MDHRSNLSGMFSARYASRRMGSNLLIMIVQIVFCIFIHDLAVSLYPKDWVFKRGIAWGIGLSYLFIYFGLLVFVLSIVDAYLVRKRYLFGAIASLIFIVIISPYCHSNPLRSMNVMLAGVSAIWLKYAVEYLLRFRGKEAMVKKHPDIPRP